MRGVGAGAGQERRQWRKRGGGERDLETEPTGQTDGLNIEGVKK